MKEINTEMMLPVTIEVYETWSWMGKTDKEGRNIDEVSYQAEIFLRNKKLAESSSRKVFKSESAAIKDAKGNT